MTFPDFCRQHGIITPDDIHPGRWIRCHTETEPVKRTGSIKLAADGRAGFALNYGTMTEAATWFPKDDSKGKKRGLCAENAERTARIQMRQREEAEGMRRARREWGNSNPLINAEHPYLEKKRLTMLGAEGLRTVAEALLVPMWRDDEFTSLQRITPDGGKKFAPGAPSKGCVFWMERDDATVTILTEGFATASTCFESVRNSRVCVCFSAANLIEVATRLDWHGFTVIASDNDHHKPCPWCQKQGEHLQNPPTEPRPSQCRCNPGHTAALAAAKVIKCGVALPPAVDEITDFNDLFNLRLAEREASALRLPHPPPPSSLRRSALTSIGAALMNSAKFLP